jgi:hypothetical protein
VAVRTVGFRNSLQTTVVVWEITVRHLIYPLLLGAWLLGATTPANAASVCVDTVSELLSAINDYDDQTGPSTYTIKVVRGTYAVGAGLISTVHDAGFEEVTFQLLGGYSANCTSRTINPANTVIDAAGQANTGLVLQPAFNADVLIEGVTFTRFNSANALYVQFLTNDTDDATYRVRYSAFSGNAVGTAVNLTGSTVAVTNSLIAANQTSGAAVKLFHRGSNENTFVTNTTIAANTGGGLSIEYSSPTSRKGDISNNIIYGNGGFDLAFANYDLAGSMVPQFNGNTFGTVQSIYNWSSFGTGNLQSNPLFLDVAGGNFRLNPNSPAVNSATPFQINGLPSRDLDGGERVVGSNMDRGAYETDVDDRTTFIVTTSADNGNNTSPTTGSLRAGMKAANSAGGPYLIKFNIATSCPFLITMNSTPMLDIVGNVTIDGTTQPGWVGNSEFGRFDATLCGVVYSSSAAPYAFRVPSSAPTSARLVVKGLMFAGFAEAAIVLAGGDNHRVQGNQFGGVPFTVANAQGIKVTTSAGIAMIGSANDPELANMISGGTSSGITLDNVAGGNTVAGNLIGFAADGIAGLGNGANGINIFNSPSNLVEYNYVGYNQQDGVGISGIGSTNNNVVYNLIGKSAYFSLSEDAGNLGDGVEVGFGATNTFVGASESGTAGGNIVANNDGAGVRVSGLGSTFASRTRVLANTMYANTGLDIDLGSAGPTANVATNPGNAPNHAQNYPELSAAQLQVTSGGSQILVDGSLHSAPNATFRIDVYWDFACGGEAGDRGEAYDDIGHAEAFTDASGNATFQFGLSTAHTTPGAVSATATNANGETSEIGNCIAVSTSPTGLPIFANGFE